MNEKSESPVELSLSDIVKRDENIQPSDLRAVIPKLVNDFNMEAGEEYMSSDKFVKLTDSQIKDLFVTSVESKFKINNKYISGVVIGTKSIYDINIFNKIFDLFFKDPEKIKTEISELENKEEVQEIIRLLKQKLIIGFYTSKFNSNNYKFVPINTSYKLFSDNVSFDFNNSSDIEGLKFSNGFFLTNIVSTIYTKGDGFVVIKLRFVTRNKNGTQEDLIKTIKIENSSYNRPLEPINLLHIGCMENQFLQGIEFSFYSNLLAKNRKGSVKSAVTCGGAEYLGKSTNVNTRRGELDLNGKSDKNPFLELMPFVEIPDGAPDKVKKPMPGIGNKMLLLIIYVVIFVVVMLTYNASYKTTSKVGRRNTNN